MGIGRQVHQAWSRKPKRSKDFSVVVRSYRVSIAALALGASGCAVALYQAIETGRFIAALVVGTSTLALVLAPMAFKNVIEWRPSQELLDELGIQSLGSLDRTSKVLRSSVSPDLLSGWHDIIADDDDYRSLVASIELALVNAEASSIFVADIGAESHRENFTKSLASTYSAIGYRTVAVDLGFSPSFENLRGPDQPEHSLGFYQIITKQSSVREALVRSGDVGSTLLYLPSGGPVSTASSPYLSPRLTETIRYLGANSDRVIMSGGSAIGAREELVPACAADCVVVLARRSTCSEAIIRQAVRNLTKTGTPVIGICFIEEPALLSTERTRFTPAADVAGENQLSASQYLEQVERDSLAVEDELTVSQESSETESPIEENADSESLDAAPAQQDIDYDEIDQFEDDAETTTDEPEMFNAKIEDIQIDDSDSDELVDSGEPEDAGRVEMDLRDESSDSAADINVFDKPPPNPPDPSLQPTGDQHQHSGILSETDNADRYNVQATEPLLQRLQFWKKRDQPFPARSGSTETKPEPIAKPLGVPVEDSGGSLFGARTDDEYDPLLAETVELESLFDIDAFDSDEVTDSSTVEIETLEQSDT